MLTRCPACQTLYRIATDQLRARSGLVRCGRCGHPFNALESLRDEVIAQAASAAEAIAVPAASQTPPVERESSDIEVPAVSTAEFSFSAQSSAEVPAPLAASELPIALPAGMLATQAAPDSSDASLPATIAEWYPPAAQEAATNTLGERAHVTPSATQGDVADAVPEHPYPEHGEIFPGAPDQSADDVLPALAPRPQPRRLLGVAIWSVLVVSTLAILMAQTLYFLRDDLALLSPALRPLILQLCTPVKCKLSVPRIASLMSIEASALELEPNHQNVLILSATLKNHATVGKAYPRLASWGLLALLGVNAESEFAQAYPSLELTLTAGNDLPLARRVLHPADYSDLKEHDPVQGVAGGADIAVQIQIDGGQIKAAGYRLYLFYP